MTRVDRHTNVAAAFALIAALSCLIGSVTFGMAMEKRASATTHALAATPLVVATASTAIAYTARKRAAALRDRDTSAAEANDERRDDRLPPAA